MYTYFQCSRFPFLFNHYFHFSLRFLHHLFNSCRMNTSIHNQFFKRNPSHFTTNWIKTGQNNRFRRIVNNKVNPSHCLEGSNIPALSTDNSSFHFVIRKLYHRYCRLGNMIRRTFLYRGNHILLRFLICFFLRSAFHFFNHYSRFVFHFIFNNFQQIIFCLFGG